VLVELGEKMQYSPVTSLLRTEPTGDAVAVTPGGTVPIHAGKPQATEPSRASRSARRQSDQAEHAPPSPPRKPKPAVDRQAEQQALRELQLADTRYRARMWSAAAKAYRQIVKKYPGTNAARLAQEKVDELSEAGF
jgi:hypothetical protein